MRETTWISASKDKIDEIASDFIKSTKCGYTEISISILQKVNIRVYACSELYLNYLNKNFSPADTLSETAWITLYYDSGSISYLSSFGYDINNIKTPCVGLFDELSNIGFISGIDEYGLLKSTIVGMHSRLLLKNGWIPIHGAVISYNGRGVIIVGYHGAGKSTALLNIINYAKDKANIGMLTDDWAVACKNSSIVKVHSIERNMSFNKSLILDNPELNLTDIYEQQALAGLDKMWIDINDVFQNNIFVEETVLKKVLVLSSEPAETVINEISLLSAAELLADSSYHMPDTGEQVKKSLLSFWCDILKNIDVIQVNTRSFSKTKDDIYKEILLYLSK